MTTCAACKAPIPGFAETCPSCGTPVEIEATRLKPGSNPQGNHDATQAKASGQHMLLEGKWALQELLGKGGMGY